MRTYSHAFYIAGFMALAVLFAAGRAEADEQQPLIATNLPADARWPLVAKFDDAIDWQADRSAGVIGALLAGITNSKASKQAVTTARSLEGASGAGIEAAVREVFECGTDASVQTFCSEFVPASSVGSSCSAMSGKGASLRRSG